MSASRHPAFVPVLLFMCDIGWGGPHDLPPRLNCEIHGLKYTISCSSARLRAVSPLPGTDGSLPFPTSLPPLVAASRVSPEWTQFRDRLAATESLLSVADGFRELKNR